MVRRIDPRRGIAAGARLAAEGERTLAALAALREEIAALGRKLAPPPDPARALEPVRKKLDELAAQARDQKRRLDEIAQSLTAPEPPSAPQRPLPALRRLLARLPSTPAPAAAPPAAPAPPPLPPATSLLTGAKRHGDGRAVLALALGLPPEAQAELVARLAMAPPLPGLVPVWVTDGLAFEPFRRHGAFFEHLPQPRTGDDRDWELYRIRRFAILCRKWQPLRIVAFGTAARQWLAMLKASPHAPAELAALLGAGEAPEAPARPA